MPNSTVIRKHKNTVADLIEYLQSLPGETEIDVLVSDIEGYNTITKYVDLDLDDHLDFTDFTGHLSIHDKDPRYNKKYLSIGRSE